MNNFLLKTQINDNPPQLCWTYNPFDITRGAAIKQNLDYIMRSHFLDSQPQRFWVEWTKPIQFEYGIGEQVLVDGGLVNKCFTRESARAYVANHMPSNWHGDWEYFKNLVLATPEDKLNDFLAPYHLNVPAFDKPTGYRDTLKILRTTGEDTLPSGDNVQYIDAFDFLKEHLENHVSELDDSGFSVAILKDDSIVFTTAAMIVYNWGAQT